MSCPYPSCGRPELPSSSSSCPTCRRAVKHCASCGVFNRTFAAFCRGCGKGLPEEAADWPGARGGPERMGWNRTSPGCSVWQLSLAPLPLELSLGERCQSLLAAEGHLLALGKSGRLRIADLERALVGPPLALAGPPTCEPFVHRGLLFLGSGQSISAYGLAALTAAEPRPEAAWTRALPGTPVGSLLALGERLYVLVRKPGGVFAVMAIEGILDPAPREVRELAAGGRLSQLAASAVNRRVFFLAEDGAALRLYSADHARSEAPALTSRLITRAPLPLAEEIPIGVVGAKLFAVLGEREELSKLDAHEGTFDGRLREDTKSYALAGSGDGVLINTLGVSFLAAGKRDDFPPQLRPSVPPLVIRDCAAMLGFRDGRLRAYDLKNPPGFREERLGEAQDAITALISFRRWLVAGNEKGQVSVLSLEPK